jgi:hypothetical protein
MPVTAMTSHRQPDNVRTRCDRAGDTNDRVFDNERTDDVRADGLSGVEVNVRPRLAPRHMLATRIDVVAEAPTQAKMIEVAGNPLRGAG